MIKILYKFDIICKICLSFQHGELAEWSKLVSRKFGRKINISYIIYMQTKICNNCLKDKTLDQFSLLKKGKFGRHPKCNECRNEKAREKYKNGEITYTPWSYSRQLKRYGLTLDDYNKMIDNQDGRCKICNEEDKLVVDHCHSTGNVRGLLCTSCNTALGKFKDNVELLNKAIKYLKGEFA